jgi:hypothetical protein
MATKYGMYENVIPLLAPVDIAATATNTSFVDLDGAHEVSFFVYFGVITAASTAQTGPTITIHCATTAATTAATTIPFYYRLSAATGTNTWGAVTSCASSGYTISISGDGMMVQFIVDPAEAQADHDLGRYLYVRVTPLATYGTPTLVSIFAVTNPRYKQTSMIAAS